MTPSKTFTTPRETEAMGRMQFLGLCLVLMLSWAGWVSSATVEPMKTAGLWYHIFTASNELEDLRDDDYLRLYSPSFDCSGPNCNAISLEFQYSYLGCCRRLSTVMEKQRGGLYQTEIPPENILEILYVGNSMMLLGSEYRILSNEPYAILALGRERMLSEADMEKFRKVLKQKGIMAEPVRFTGDDVCIDGDKSKE